jgi:hypothetical protein
MRAYREIRPFDAVQEAYSACPHRLRPQFLSLFSRRCSTSVRVMGLMVVMVMMMMGL